MSEAALTALVLHAALVLARVAGAVMLLPGFGEVSVPPTVRMAIALSLTLIILPLIAPELPVVPETPFALGAALMNETVTGLYLGWLVRIIVLAFPIAGQIISYQIGLSNVILPNQQLGGESTLLSTSFGMATPALIFSSGIFALPIMALVHSYHLLPPDQFLKASDMVRIAVKFADQEFLMAIHLAAPFLFAGLLWQAGLAVIARLVPQIQIFFIAAPGQIYGGLALLGFLCMTLISLWEHDVSQAIIQSLGG